MQFAQKNCEIKITANFHAAHVYVFAKLVSLEFVHNTQYPLNEND